MSSASFRIRLVTPSLEEIPTAVYRTLVLCLSIRVYDEAGNVIETREHAGEFCEF
jgi:hypothetical protein